MGEFVGDKTHHDQRQEDLEKPTNEGQVMPHEWETVQRKARNRNWCTLPSVNDDVVQNFFGTEKNQNNECQVHGYQHPECAAEEILPEIYF